MSVDGVRHDYGHADGDYQTDVLGAEAVRTIGEAAHAGKPFYVSFTPLSPHVESAEKTDLSFRGYRWPLARPAPRSAGTFGQEPLPKTASYNEADVSAKPDFIKRRHPITTSVEELATKAYRIELETLKATDEWVGKIVQALKDDGVWSNTLVVFTSDNGLFHGEHRIPNGKLYLYEPDVHLPLLVEGPGVPKGVTVDQVVGNVDLAPTILGATSATNAGATFAFDGRDVLPLARDASVGRGRAMLLENTKSGAVLSEGLHTDRFVYLEDADGTRELYDLASDPDEVRNLHGDAIFAAVESNLAARLAVARTCSGASCEGSDAGHNAVPDAPAPIAARPLPAGPTSAPVDPPAAKAAAPKVDEAVGALTTLFDLTHDEQECARKALSPHVDLLVEAGGPILNDSRALVNAVGMAKSCVAPDRLGTGLAAVLGTLTQGRIASDGAVCAGKAMAGLDEAAFAAMLDYLVDPTSDPDVEARSRASAFLQTCKIDPRTVLG